MYRIGHGKMFQVSTLQALALGYSRAVIDVAELMRHGDTGLGTFEDVNGEMIVLEGRCYQADEKGEVREACHKTGVPYALKGASRDEIKSVEQGK